MLQSKIPRLVTEMLFRYTPAIHVIRSSYGKKLTPAEIACKHTHGKICEDMIIRLMLNRQNTFSQSEIEERLRYSLPFLKKNIANSDTDPTIFNLIALQANQFLNDAQNSISVKFEHLLRWRQISYKLGVDIFVCSLIAQKDLCNSITRIRSFKWPIVLPHDNVRLNEIFQTNKLNENHAHLKATGPVVHPAWLSLMNKIAGRESEFELAKLNSLHLDPVASPYPNIPTAELYIEVIMAAQLRMILYSKLRNRSSIQVHRNLLNRLEQIANAPEYLLRMTTQLQEEIDHVRFETRAFNYGFDYISQEGHNADSSNISMLYSGERWLYYNMLKGIFEGNTDILPFADAFYAYILIKARFRAEFIQINNRPGFKNFMKYESRKDILIDSDPILAHARIHLAINNAFNNQNVSTYDLRVKPKSTPGDIVKQIGLIQYYIHQNPLDKRAKDNALSELEKNRKKRNKDEVLSRVKLVFHFVKEPEENSSLSFYGIAEVRNKKLRAEVKEQAAALCGVIEKQSNIRCFIKAIDAANNELGCRPEVFAQAFRYVKRCSIRAKGSGVNYFTSSSYNPITLKHHCGEEFLDIVDGLRYIDETILFMEMSERDHLGHALALGLNAESWYESKCYSVTLPGHDYLDNLVWLLKTMDSFAVVIPEPLRIELLNQFTEIASFIYGNKDINLDVFYDAWQLRGDDPEIYRSGRYLSSLSINAWSAVAKCSNVPDSLRSNQLAVSLFYRYHHDLGVRTRGEQAVYIKVSTDFIQMVTEAQTKMREKILQKGLVIETLPSCNVAISTFKRYDKHPIFTFFDPLISSKNEFKLNVSINTDNPGIFDTSLENEFALMAIAMQKCLNDDGFRRYSDDQIEKWLIEVNAMGLNQVIT